MSGCPVFYQYKIVGLGGQCHEGAGAACDTVFLVSENGPESEVAEGFCPGIVGRKQFIGFGFTADGLVPAVGALGVGCKLLRAEESRCAAGKTGLLGAGAGNAVIGIYINERRVYELSAAIDHHRIFGDADVDTHGFYFPLADDHAGIFQSITCVFENGGIGKCIATVFGIGHVVDREGCLGPQAMYTGDRKGQQHKQELDFFHAVNILIGR